LRRFTCGQAEVADERSELAGRATKFGRGFLGR